MKNKIYFLIKKKISFVFFIIKNFNFFFYKLILIFKSKFMKNRTFYAHEDLPNYDLNTKTLTEKINRETKETYKNFNENKKDITRWLENKNLTISQIKKVIKYNENNTIDIKELVNQGVQNFNKKIIGTNDIDIIIKKFRDLKVYPAHVPIFSIKKKDTINNIKKISPFGSYDQIDILSDENLFKFITNREILEYSIKYFGCVPTLANINLYWSFVTNKRSGPQNYHRDIDDYKILNVFMNLTETSFNNGSYEHVKFSHDYNFLNNELNQSSLIKRDIKNFFNINYNGYGSDIYLNDEFFKDKVEQIYGSKGSINFADGFGLHRAVTPTKNDRLILWMTFGLRQTNHENTSNKYQRRIKSENITLKEFDKNLINKYVYRHLIDFSDESSRY